MNILPSTQSGALPSYLFHQPPCAKPFPHVVEVGDAWGKIGSGIGNECSSELTALGEYFERRHFYMEVSSDNRGRLADALGATESLAFKDAFLQTAQGMASPSELDEHIFALTTANRISDFSSCQIPTITLNLTHSKVDPDNRFYPERDTCGCSFHISSQSSIFGAIKESLERQFLTRFWLTKQCNRKWQASELRALLHGRSTLGLLELLSKAGKVHAFDISDQRFPGRCVILIYGNENISSHVKYCAGMSYASTLADSIEKSLHELWQTFRFMQLFGALKRSPRDIEDPYLRHFLNANSIDTFNEISNISTGSPNLNPLSPYKNNMTIDGLISTLKCLKIEGYLYTKKINFFGNYYTFSKFLSPSLFLHMNNSKNINIRNLYSSTFLDKIIPSRQSVMVPFP
ncbi:YcaO-like family protein [Pseudomonas abietaniphila]|jgi:hypothetical protein|uniref:YcaO-like family protein n=1 Tax=Pseudomonas abietaniphila TaxID=89065 RepID=A0A1G7VR57_9PSED|nr:YcaO-like family protein [Pseudomonas abietaniphila]SDG62233.1 YcaO-like family protein [Pseudomonas abietaniphila]